MGMALALSLSGAVVVAGPVAASPALPSAPERAAQVPTDDTTGDQIPVEETPAEETPADDTVAEDPGVDAADDDPESDSGAVDAENRRILLIIIGLVAVAIAIALLTIRYWRQTKPVLPQTDDVDDGSPADDPEAGDDPYADLFEPVAESSRRSRRAVAGADHPEADEQWVPRGTGEHDRIEVAEASTISKPSGDQRAAAFRAKNGR